MEIGNFSLGNSEIGNCSYENPHVSLSLMVMSFLFAFIVRIDQAAFLFTFIRRRKGTGKLDIKLYKFSLTKLQKMAKFQKNG